MQESQATPHADSAKTDRQQQRREQRPNWLRRLWRFSNKPSVATAYFTGTLAVVAIVQAIVLLETIERASETARIQLRAYVFLEWIVVTYDETTNSITVTAQIKNSGQTPAKYVEAMACVKCEPPTFEGPFTPCPADENVRFVMASGASQPIPSGLILQSTDVAPFKTGEKILWVFGEVKYRDVFQQNHVSRFRFYQLKLPNSGAIEIGYTLQGNDEN